MVIWLDREKEVRIGKGRVLIPESISRNAGNFWILIYVTHKKGPCKDEICQMIEEVNAIVSEVPQDGMVEIKNDLKLNIATDRFFLDSVDRERKTVRLYKSFSGKIKVRGF